MKYFLTFLATLALSAFVLAASVVAQSPSPEPSSTPSETTENLRERIEKIVEEQRGKVQSLLGQGERIRQGFIGEITRVSSETLAVNISGATRIVPLDSSVEIVLGANTIQPESIEVGNWVTVMGIRQEDSFSPKKILVSRTSLRPSIPVVYLATLKDIKTSALDFQPRGLEEVMTATITRTTDIQDNTGEETSLSNFFTDDQVLLVGHRTDSRTTITTLRALAPFSRGE